MNSTNKYVTNLSCGCMSTEERLVNKICRQLLRMITHLLTVYTGCFRNGFTTLSDYIPSLISGTLLFYYFTGFLQPTCGF